jgi:hypothetical protein
MNAESMEKNIEEVPVYFESGVNLLTTLCHPDANAPEDDFEKIKYHEMMVEVNRIRKEKDYPALREWLDALCDKEHPTIFHLFNDKQLNKMRKKLDIVKSVPPDTGSILKFFKENQKKPQSTMNTENRYPAPDKSGDTPRIHIIGKDEPLAPEDRIIRVPLKQDKITPEKPPLQIADIANSEEVLFDRPTDIIAEPNEEAVAPKTIESEFNDAQGRAFGVAETIEPDEPTAEILQNEEPAKEEEPAIDVREPEASPEISDEELPKDTTAENTDTAEQKIETPEKPKEFVIPPEETGEIQEKAESIIESIETSQKERIDAGNRAEILKKKNEAIRDQKGLIDSYMRTRERAIQLQDQMKKDQEKLRAMHEKYHGLEYLSLTNLKTVVNNDYKKYYDDVKSIEREIKEKTGISQGDLIQLWEQYKESGKKENQMEETMAPAEQSEKVQKQTESIMESIEASKKAREEAELKTAKEKIEKEKQPEQLKDELIDSYMRKREHAIDLQNQINEIVNPLSKSKKNLLAEYKNLYDELKGDEYEITIKTGVLRPELMNKWKQYKESKEKQKMLAEHEEEINLFEK